MLSCISPFSTFAYFQLNSMWANKCQASISHTHKRKDCVYYCSISKSYSDILCWWLQLYARKNEPRYVVARAYKLRWITWKLAVAINGNYSWTLGTWGRIAMTPCKNVSIQEWHILTLHVFSFSWNSPPSIRKCLEKYFVQEREATLSTTHAFNVCHSALLLQFFRVYSCPRRMLGE